MKTLNDGVNKNTEMMINGGSVEMKGGATMKGLKLGTLIERYEGLKEIKRNKLIAVIKAAGYSVINNSKDELIIVGVYRYNKLYESILSVIEMEKEIAIAKQEKKVLTKEEKIEAIKVQLSKRITTAKQLQFIRNLDGEVAYRLLKEYVTAVEKKNRKNFRNVQAIKHNSKEIPVVLIRRIEVDAIEDKQNDTIEFINSNFVQPVQESELIRAIGTELVTMGDAGMSLTGQGTHEICTLSLGKGLLKKSRLSEILLRKVFNMLLSTSDEKITLVISPSGLARVELKKDFKLMMGEVAYEYELLGVTPSGFRSGSLMLGAVNKTEMKDGLQISTNIDRRIEILDNASDGAFITNFMQKDENGELVFKSSYKDLIALFKAVGRILLPATASRNMGEISTYIVFKNIAQKAMYNKNDYNTPCYSDGVNCEDTKDGAIFASTKVKQRYLLNNNIPASVIDIALDCNQTRGGGTKDSAQYLEQRDMKILIEALLARGTEVEYVVYKGEKVELKDIDMKEFLNEVEVIADTNAMKLLKHKETWNMLDLKPAYASDTSLNMVINIAMLFQDTAAAKELLLNLGIKKIYEKFEDLGFVFDFDEDGAINSVNFDFDKLERINNDSQLANWLYKSNPLKISAAIPQIFKSILLNNNISIKNLIDTLSIEVDSLYMVVQADIAPLFGVRLIDDGEVFCPEFEDVEYVAGARHPISGPYSVSTFKTLTKEDLILRINKLKVSYEIKDLLIRRISSIRNFVEIPACHYLMEKHDGMDFDIDAMQWFKEKEVVDILRQIPDIGTKIDRSKDVEKNISTNNSAAELAIKKWKEKGGQLLRPENVKAKTTASRMKVRIKNTKSTGNYGKSSVVKNSNGMYSVDFDSVTNLIFDYFNNPIDPVGFIATGFYNNALLYLVMRSKDVSEETKEGIATVIRTAFGCSGLTSEYVTPIERKVIGVFNGKKRTEVILHKELCTEVMMRYAESKGSIDDTIKFLADACICNRYPAETSIDSAKNKYAIVDMFNLGRIIKALGSDKNMKTKLYGYDTDDRDSDMETSNAIFEGKINAFNDGLEEGAYNSGNFFGLGLLYNDFGDAFRIEGLDTDAINNNIAKGSTPAVMDALGEVREELTDLANDLIVLCSKEMENYVRSEDARKIRNAFIEKYADSITVENKKFFKVDSIISSIMRTYLTVSENIRTNETKELDEVNARVYMKTTAIQACRNMATLAFKTSESNLSDEQIGCAVMYLLASSFNESEKTGECKSVNTALLDIFGPELVAFLTAEGFNTKVGEKILYMNNDNLRQVKIDNYVGEEVCAYKGHGVVETEDEEINVVFESKKATLEGTIEKYGHEYYALTDREFVENNLSAGIYVPVKTESFLLGNGVSLNDFIAISFRKNFVDGYGVKKYNSIVGITNEGIEVVIAELYINSTVATFIEKIELNQDNIRFFVSDKSICIHFNDEKLMNEIDFATEVNTNEISSNDFSFAFNSNISIPTSFSEVAISQESNISKVKDNKETNTDNNVFSKVAMPTSLS